MKKHIVTHSSRFHADDVFAVATLSLVFGRENIEISRTRDGKIIEAADIVVDVGGEYDPLRMRFDHHQEGGAGRRENELPYASFGLVWKEFGEKLCGAKDVAEMVDRKLVGPVDAADSGLSLTDKNNYDGIFYYRVEDVIESYLPTWKEKYSFDAKFPEVVKFAAGIIEREVRIAKDKLEAKKIILENYQTLSDKRLLVMDRKMPWSEASTEMPELLYVIFPNEEEKAWYVQAARKDIHRFENRKDFPIEWAGKKGKELAALLGVNDAIFSHNNRFLVVVGSKESALKVAELALKA